MNRSRILTLFLVVASTLCVISLRRARSQSNGLRRITNTTEEGISINPSISGDGRIVAFESTEDVAGAGGSDHFRAIRANISMDPASFFQMGGTRAVTPAISQDGSRIAFASKDDPLGTNPDGNSEIFLFDGARLIQVTNTAPGDLANRVANGNFQPSISDDGRFIAFSSNRDLASQNGDGNLEIFVYDMVASTFNQLTNSSGIIGATDAKISGNAAKVAYIRDPGTTTSTKRDLLVQDRVSGPPTVMASQVQSLLLTYGRAISDDGMRVVYSRETAINSSQVFLYDGRNGGIIRQITSLGVRVTEVPLHPTISGDGSRIAFATRRAVAGAGNNSDGSVELYIFDSPTATFSKITNAPSSATEDVVSSLNDDGSIVVFNFPRVLSGAVVNSNSANDSEIYATAAPTRAAFGVLNAILNDASFGHEPSAVKAVAPDSIAFAQGSNLANTTVQSQRLPNGAFPTNVAGTSVTVNGRAAQIFFVSPVQVNFLMPAQTEIGNADVVVTNSENFQSRGSVPTLRSAPGVFTLTGDGTGEGVILNSDTLQPGPFDPSSDNLRLTIFATGARNAALTVVAIGGRAVNAESVMASLDMPGLDEVHLLVPRDLRGVGTVSLSVQSDGRDSNPVTATFAGDFARDVFINEVLADPPDGIAGDANHDGVRDGTDDEFIELVNATSNETIALSGWTIKTRAATGAETTRFTFASGTALPAGGAIVVFGGGSFNSLDPVFGCAQVVKASTSSGLSLTNGGLTILVQDAAGNPITQFAYGGSTGLDGNNNRSLTRSPDVTGAFVQHTSGTGANGRRFSPGLKVDGTPFGSCPGHPAMVTISPSSTSVNVGQTAQFMAQTFDQYGRVMTSATMTFVSDNTTVATIDSTSINPTTGVATGNVGAHNPGTAHITASSNDGTTTANSSPATLNVNGPVLSIDDVSANEGNSGTTTFTFTVTSNFPAPAGGITFDIASADGTATAASGDYVSRSLTGQAIPAGQNSYMFNVSVNGDTLVEPNETFFVNLSNPSGGATIRDSQGVGTIENDDLANLVISQTYPGGGLTGASFTNDFIELFNRGATTVDFALTPYSVQFLSTGATAWAKTDLTSGTLAPGRYFLIKETFGGGNGAPLPTADATGTLNLTSTTAGKVALVSSTTPLTGNCPGDDGAAPFSPINATVADFVGYGGTTSAANHCYEGSGPASFTLSNNTIAEFRKAGGCIDTNDNAPDFFTSTPFPRNSNSPPNNCAGGATPNLSINDVTVAEGNSGTTAATFTVSLSTLAEGADVTFDIATQDSTATIANNDYAAKSLTNQIIPAGQTTYTFSVLVNGDANVEPDETLFVNVTNVAGAAVTKGQGTGTIQNDDFPTLSISDVSANEGDLGTTTFTFTVSLSAPAPAPVNFDIATQNGTATVADNDYVAKNLTGQTIAAGQQTYHFDGAVNGDTKIEPDETFFVNVTNVGGATVNKGQGIGTIKNDDSPSLSINDAMLNEGDSGTTPFTFTVTLSPASTDTVTVNYATANGTASAPGDYTAIPATLLTFAPGETSKPVTVQVKGDKLVEPDETFSVNLSSSTNANISRATGAGTITNDDTARLVISQIYGGGNNSGATFQNDFVEIFNRGTTTVNFAVTPYSVQYASASGTFSSGNTISLNSGSLVPGQYFLIKLAGGTTNGVALPTEDASNSSINMSATDGKVALVIGTTVSTTTAGCPTAVSVADFLSYGSANCSESAPTAALSATKSALRKSDGCTDTDNNSADFTTLALNSGTPPRNSASPLNDCNAPPTLSINAVTLAEGASGTTTFSFTVSLSKPALAGGATFDIATQDGTATLDDNDYIAKALTAQTIPPGQQTHTFDVLVNGDAKVESDETFFANVTNVTGATLVKGQGVGTILNDDSPSLSIDDVSLNEGNSGTTSFNFTVTLSQASAQTVTVSYASANSTATAPSDYTAIPSTQLTFTPGQTTKTITIAVNGDRLVEPDETFFVNLSGPSNATISKGQGIGTIVNDDTPLLVISQLFGGGGNSGAAYQNDVVELFNRGTTTVNFSVTPYSVQYASSAGSFSSPNKVDLTTGTMAPGQYFLIKLAAGGAVGQTFTADVTNTGINMSATEGKLALVVGTTVATTTSGCPTVVTVADLLGYGAANCAETTATAVLSATKVDLRKANGCTDTNSNASDFTVTTVNTSSALPRNSSSPLAPCP